MQGKTIIFICLIILSGCSVLRRNPDTGKIDRSGSNVSLERIKSLNISDSGFFISRASLEITGSDINEKAICSVKYNAAGEYLISVRSRTGIEGGRMYISSDTVLINDRINRILYFGDPEKLSGKYGIEYLMIPLIFGDYITGVSVDSAVQDCVDGQIRKKDVFNGNSLSYVIDCKEDKIISADLEAGSSLKLTFRDFKSKGLLKYPEIIEAENVKRRFKVRLEIENIVHPWEGNIEFLPGSNYEQVPLI